VLPGRHEPSSEQPDQSDQRPLLPSHVRVCSPQLPQLRAAAPRQTWPLQLGSQRQLSSQRWLPLAPQLRSWSGAQTPCPLQLDQSDQRALVSSQRRVWTPQFPQVCVGGPLHTWPLQAPSQAQLPPQIWVPLEPQLRAASGAHTPSPLQADHSDQVAVSGSQMRVREPQLPQICSPGPLQTWSSQLLQ
jgi:hypothetical protein